MPIDKNQNFFELLQNYPSFKSTYIFTSITQNSPNSFYKFSRYFLK